jgi:hypothetical protein
MERRDNFLGLE